MSFQWLNHLGVNICRRNVSRIGVSWGLFSRHQNFLTRCCVYCSIMSIMSTTLPVVWTILHSYLHGYHQASLNGIQDVLTCSPSADSSTRAGLRGCIDITVSLSLIHQGRELWADVEVSQNTQFGVVTTILTIGGLLGALGADRLTNAFGRVGALRVAELSFILGAILVGTANGLAMMIVGRYVLSPHDHNMTG